MDYSKPRNRTGNWDIDVEYNDEDEPTGDNLMSLTLMRDNKNTDANGKPCCKQMLTELEASMPQDIRGENDLRLIVAAPKMYEALLAVKKMFDDDSKPATEGDLDAADVEYWVTEALNCAEKFEFPWEPAED